MASVRKVTRLANPRRRRGKFRLRTARKRNAKKRLSPKQIRFFGTPRQKAALKRHRVRKRTRSVNPKRRKVRVVYKTRKASRPRRRRRSNPALIMTLGSINPRKRRTIKVAGKRRNRRRATNPRRRVRRTSNVRRVVRRRRRTVNRRRNPRKVYVANPRRRRYTRRRRVNSSRRRRVGGYRRRRNPAIFGQSSPSALFKMVGGGLVGVTVTKMIPAYIPASITSTLGSGSFMAIAVSAASAFAAGFLAKKFMGTEFGDAVLFGGLMQTGSVALNALLPASISGQFSLGDLVNGNFVVPQNPIRAAQMAQVAAAAAAAAPIKPGMGAAYPSAY
jgi:hypothetical protein